MTSRDTQLAVAFFDGHGCFREGLGGPESVAIARYSGACGVIGKAFNP